LVVTTAAEGIILNCDRDEFSKLEPFNQTYFVHSDLPHYATDPKLTLLWPFAVSTERTVDISIRSIPEGELAVHRGAKVLATGGAIGRVDEFLVNPESCQITHLVVREDRPRKDNLIIVPLSLIDQIKENEVYLKVEKVIVEEIPDNQIKRQW
jgi:sporulation protein YlmC with PRC-barrel domain